MDETLRRLRRITDSFPVREKDAELAMKFSQDLDKEGESPTSHKLGWWAQS